LGFFLKSHYLVLESCKDYAAGFACVVG